MMRHLIMGLVVIAASLTLPEPWMVAMQASFGGLLVGLGLERLRVSRTASAIQTGD
jgi:hypothetical protein